MISVGIDIGSRTVKLAVVENGRLLLARKRENSFDPIAVCREMMADVRGDVVTATGYGRHLFAEHVPCGVISEIKAFALGARVRYPSCRTILDMGGQDIKAIALEERGTVRKFEMNDKCSAGTGRFLEVMAMVLGCAMADFGAVALRAAKAAKINSMCTVFAESEVVALLARGAAREEVALGIHQAIVGRIRSLLGRVPIEGEIIFSGGVAYNPCVVALLRDSIAKPIHVPDDPQIIGALGCAVYGAGLLPQSVET